MDSSNTTDSSHVRAGRMIGLLWRKGNYPEATPLFNLGRPKM
jgi:hypothetical protein